MATTGKTKTILRWVVLIGLGAAMSYAALKLYEDLQELRD